MKQLSLLLLLAPLFTFAQAEETIITIVDNTAYKIFKNPISTGHGDSVIFRAIRLGEVEGNTKPSEIKNDTIPPKYNNPKYESFAWYLTKKYSSYGVNNSPHWSVDLFFDISPTGEVLSLDIQGKLPKTISDEIASVISQSAFTPATIAGVPVKFTYHVICGQTAGVFWVKDSIRPKYK